MGAKQLPIEEKQDSDLVPIAEVAAVLGVARRTLDRWAVDKDGPEKRTLALAGDKTPRVYLSWSAVVSYCEVKGKLRELLRAKQYLGQAQTPDPTLSDMLSTLAHDGLSDRVSEVSKRGMDNGEQASLREGDTSPATKPSSDAQASLLRQDLEEAKAECARLTNELHAAHVELAVQREAVKRLEVQLTSAHKRAEAQAFDLQARMDTQLLALQSNHDEALRRADAQMEAMAVAHRETVQQLTNELKARRLETAEMRQASERQQQREAALRWQTATSERDRDLAVATLRELHGASWWQRLTWRPPALEMKGSANPGTMLPAVVEVEAGDD